MANINDKPRWIYRFYNFKRAFILLREAINVQKERSISQLEKEGIIQRFEYTWELAWKVLKDYLEYNGVVLETVTPASVLRAAFEAKIINEGDIWMRALDARNKMSHTYNVKVFEAVIGEIEREFLRVLEEMYLKLFEIAIQQGDHE